MQRSTAITQVLLLLAFYLAPFAGATPASTPLCCRGNGAHHCAQAAQMPVSGPILQQRIHCPYQFSSVLLTHVTKLFLTRACDSAPELPTQALRFGTARYIALHSGSYSIDSRGPPTLFL